MNRVFKVSEEREIIASEWGDNLNPLVIMLHGGGKQDIRGKALLQKLLI